MIDKYGREIDYLRISLTDNCIYCMPDNIKFNKRDINETLSFEDYKFFIKSFSDIGITKIRFTGGEPLLYPYLRDLIQYTNQECNIRNIAITTNGVGLANICDELYKFGLKTVNISLDSLKEYKYRAITRGGDLKKVLESINRCLYLGIKVKINCVLIKGFNDDEIDDFLELIKCMPIDVRFIELMPIGEAKELHENGFISPYELIKDIPNLYEEPKNEKSVATYFKIIGSKGRIGIITPMSCSFCKQCNRIRLTSNGFLKLCLHSREEIDLKEYIGRPLLFREYIKDTFCEKPKKHNLLQNKRSDTHRRMNQIGG